jgi:hypothetical protein
MVISLVVGILNLVIVASLIVRGIANDESNVQVSQGRYAEISEHIFRWSYLGILAVYYTLIHHNARSRLTRRRSTGEMEQDLQERRENENAEIPRSSSNAVMVHVVPVPPKKPSKTVTFAPTPPVSVAPPSRTSTIGPEEDDSDDDEDMGDVVEFGERQEEEEAMHLRCGDELDEERMVIV